MGAPGRALVVGLGRMGSFHAKVLRDLGYDVTTVDPDPARGADLAHVPGREHFEVACAAVPIPLLPQVARQVAARVRPRHLLVEKPFAPTSAQAVSLAAELRRDVHAVAVGFVERFNPQVRALRDSLARDAAAGSPARHVLFRRWNDRPSPDVALDLRLHDVDLALWLGVSAVAEFDTRTTLGARVRSVRATNTDGAREFDLMDHEVSPLHALWHTFLSGGDYPTPDDAVHAHRFLDLFHAPQEVLA